MFVKWLFSISQNSAVYWLARVLTDNFLFSAAMIPVVLLLCRVFHQRPAVQNLLWLIVLVRFVSPPIPGMTWQCRPIYQPVTQLADTSLLVPVPMRAEKGVTTTGNEVALDETSVPPDPTVDAVGGLQAVRSINGRSETTFWLIGCLVITIIWVFGTLLCFVRQLRRVISRYRLVSDSANAINPLAELVHRVAKRMGLTGLSTCIVSGVASPFLCCVGRVRLVWPQHLQNADTVSVRAIVAHEVAHLRRGDHFVAWLEFLASAVWWWNPLFWFVRRQWHCTADMACDALALAMFPEDRCVYAETLLWLSAGSKTGAAPLALTVGGGTLSSIERRMLMIVSGKVSGRLSGSGLLFAAVLAVVAIPGSLLSKQPDTPNQSADNTQAASNSVQENISPDQFSGELTVRVYDGQTGTVITHPYITLWRALESDQSIPNDGIVWADDQKNVRWVRAGAAHPNDGRHRRKGEEQFHFKKLTPGNYRVTTVSYHPDVRTPDATPYGLSDPFSIDSSEMITVEVKSLRGDSDLTIQAIDAETRSPIERISLRLRNRDGMPIVHGHGTGNYFERTSEQGEVRYAQLPSGEYLIEVLGKRAMVNQFVDYQAMDDPVKVIVNHPGQCKIEIAMQAHKLSQSEIDQRFPFSTYGRVTDLEGRPIANTVVRVATGMGTLRGGGNTTTDSEGNYRLYFSPGMYTEVSENAPLGVGLQAAHFFCEKPGWKLSATDGYLFFLMSDRTRDAFEETLKKNNGKVWGKATVDEVVFAHQAREINFALEPDSEPGKNPQ